MKRHFLIAFVAALFAFAGTAVAAAENAGNDMDGATSSDNGQMSQTYGAMDANADGQISQEEFDVYYTDVNVFRVWDANADGWLDEDEFGAGLFDYYDDNDDGYIDDAEWEDGVMVDDYGDNGFWDV